MSLKDSLERALDGRGCNFKVLISSGVHALVGSDAQNSDLWRTHQTFTSTTKTVPSEPTQFLQVNMKTKTDSQDLKASGNVA